MKPWRRSAAWKRRRVERLAARDGDSCWLCSLALTSRQPNHPKCTTIEHLTPRCAGGGDELENLVLCHKACNAHLRDHPREKKLTIRAKWHAEAARVAGRRG